MARMKRLLLLFLLLSALVAMVPSASASAPTVSKARVDRILRSIFRRPTWYQDKHLSRQERAVYLRPVAKAIARAARNDVEAAALVTQGWYESRYARYVIEGRCLDGPVGAQCDVTRKGVIRARGPWQVWKWCQEAWGFRQGDQAALVHEARCIARWMRGAMRRCPKGGWVAAFAGMRGGARCEWEPAKKRAYTMRKVLATL